MFCVEFLINHNNSSNHIFFTFQPSAKITFRCIVWTCKKWIQIAMASCQHISERELNRSWPCTLTCSGEFYIRHGGHLSSVPTSDRGNYLNRVHLPIRKALDEVRGTDVWVDRTIKGNCIVNHHPWKVLSGTPFYQYGILCDFE